MKAEFVKLYTDKLLNVPASLINLKTKLNDLDFGKLKAELIDFQTLIVVMDKQDVKNTNFNTLKMKENNLENEIPDANSHKSIKHR